MAVIDSPMPQRPWHYALGAFPKKLQKGERNRPFSRRKRGLSASRTMVSAKSRSRNGN